jgi:hypothetical protein
VTTRTQAVSILTANGMTIQTQNVTGVGATPPDFGIIVIPSSTLPFIDNASNQASAIIYFSNNIVSMIDLPVNISVATVIGEYGNPYQTSAIDNNNYDMVYPSLGMRFSISSMDLSRVAGLRLALPSTIQSIVLPTNSPILLNNCQVLGNPCPIPTATPVPPNLSNGTGLRGAYFDNVDFTGLRFFRQDGMVYFNWANAAPDPALGADTFAARWTGQIEALYSQTYTFFLTHNDGARLWVNGQQIINNWTNRTTAVTSSGTITLAGGARYDIRLDYFDNTGVAEVRLEWQSTSQAREVIPASQLYSTETNQLSVED